MGLQGSSHVPLLHLLLWWVVDTNPAINPTNEGAANCQADGEPIPCIIQAPLFRLGLLCLASAASPWDPRPDPAATQLLLWEGLD